jgi:hypothetical protein
MPPFGPISRRDLIQALHRAGFSGPFPGGVHTYMTREVLRVRIPNPHGSVIDRPLLARVLREAGISRQEWEVI